MCRYGVHMKNFNLAFLNKHQYEFFSSPVFLVCPSRLILLATITLMIPEE